MNTIKLLNQHRTALWITLVIVVALAGYLAGSNGAGRDDHDHTVTTELAGDSTEVIWTCSMHPQIRATEPGQCPICGMDLIPVTGSGSSDTAGPRELNLSPTAVKLASIETAPVERRFAARELSMAGTVAYDESRVRYITAWVPGRIDRLYVDYTGIPVREGDHLVDIYSPALYAAQQEYLQAIRTGSELSLSMLGSIRDTASMTVAAAREKLRLLGMTGEQIASFESQGAPSEQVTIYSPAGGIVIHKNATEGMYVNTGEKIYTVADLSRVWVLLDVYESNLQWIRYGQEVAITSEAYPGETITGRISFIDPVLDPSTRTVKVRVNVPNDAGLLKPDMFVHAAVHSEIARGGRVIDQSLAGAYICPMHPEIVSDTPGACDICGMDLVSAEQLGYISPSDVTPPLVIPRTAPLVTGKRAVVFVADAEQSGTYESREIVLGPLAGDFYTVAQGLTEGEQVVVNGAFKLDSALQIQAKPSMMSPEGGVAPPVHDHSSMTSSDAQVAQHDAADHDMSDMGGTEERMDRDQTMSDAMTAAHYTVPDAFLVQRRNVDNAYFAIRTALSHDSLEDAKTGAATLITALAGVDMGLLEHDAHMAWMAVLPELNKNAALIADADDIEAARSAFVPLSKAMITTVQSFGAADGTVYRFHCPMAENNTGADWLQNTSELGNPFFGSSMFTCGSLVEEYPGQSE